MADIGTAYVKIEPSAKGISGKISNMMEAEGKSGGTSFSNGFGSVLGGIGKAAVGAVAAGAAAVGGIVSAAVSSFGEYEQLVGGVETLFGSAADTVIKNADAAFQTAGLSANEYMQTVTSFSASLLQSVGGDTAEAAKVADMALIDMADNANKMGTSMESIQNAYQGFAKQNYTMLDNLKLGYGGTKSEMERLLADAQKLTGVKYDISNLNDVYNAIHAVQENLGITGTTAKEASETIQGSMAAMQSAWANVLTGMATDGANMDTLIEQLIGTVETFANNIMPVIETALTGVSTLIEKLAPVLAERLPVIITEALPGLLEAGVQVIQTLSEGILQAIPELMPTITDVIMKLVDMLIELAPQLIEVGMQVILELANGIAEALPELIPTIVDTVLTIVDTLIANVDMLIDAAIAIIVGLAEGLVNALPELIERLPEIIIAIVEGLVENLPKLLEASVQIIVALATGLIESLPELITRLPEIIAAIVEGLVACVGDMAEAGKELVNGLWEGIKKNWDNLASSVTELGSKLVNKVKGFFKIGSPSKLFADEIGQWIPEGIAVGIEANAGSVNSAVDDMVNDAMIDPNYNMAANTSDMLASSVNRGIMGGEDSAVRLLAEYLPMLLSAIQNNQVVLEGDAKEMFRMVRKENNLYRKANGISALA